MSPRDRWLLGAMASGALAEVLAIIGTWIEPMLGPVLLGSALMLVPVCGFSFWRALKESK